jgi:hypothetical protein
MVSGYFYFRTTITVDIHIIYVDVNRYNFSTLNLTGTIYTLNYFKWVSCHHGMARPHIENEGDCQIWRVAANISKVTDNR